MSRDGSGVYSAPAGTTVTAGTTIESAKYNAFVNDLVTDANTARPIVAGGTGATTAAGILAATGVTASVAEVNILDGVTASTAELNILDGVTATAAELNILDGATLTVTELNYVDGVTSAIQTQLDAKVDKLADPNADRIRFWDDSAGAEAYLTVGTGLSISGTTMTSGWTFIGSQAITNDATGLYTGLGAYRDIMLVVIGSTAAVSGRRILRVGNSGSGILSTSIYQWAQGAATTSFRWTDSSTAARSFNVTINGFNTTEAVKPVVGVNISSITENPVAISSTAQFDRLQVTDDGGANNINGGTMYLWGRV